jgi:hypothetical protein
MFVFVFVIVGLTSAFAVALLVEKLARRYNWSSGLFLPLLFLGATLGMFLGEEVLYWLIH